MEKLLCMPFIWCVTMIQKFRISRQVAEQSLFYNTLLTTSSPEILHADTESKRHSCAPVVTKLVTRLFLVKFVKTRSGAGWKALDSSLPPSCASTWWATRRPFRPLADNTVPTGEGFPRVREPRPNSRADLLVRFGTATIQPTQGSDRDYDKL